jgi:hypothetical protein
VTAARGGAGPPGARGGGPVAGPGTPLSEVAGNNTAKLIRLAGGPQVLGRPMIASGWRACERGALRGFVDLQMPSGLLLHGCTLMQLGERRWIGLPARPQLHRDGSPVVDPKTHKPAWAPTVEIRDRAVRVRFQQAALAAIDRLLAEGGAS